MIDLSVKQQIILYHIDGMSNRLTAQVTRCNACSCEGDVDRIY